MVYFFLTAILHVLPEVEKFRWQFSLPADVNSSSLREASREALGASD